MKLIHDCLCCLQQHITSSCQSRWFKFHVIIQVFCLLHCQQQEIVFFFMSCCLLSFQIQHPKCPHQLLFPSLVSHQILSLPLLPDSIPIPIRDEVYLKLTIYLWGLRSINKFGLLLMDHLKGSKSIYEIHPNLLYIVRSQSQDILRMTRSCTDIYEINPEQIEWREWLSSDLKRSDHDWRMT